MHSCAPVGRKALRFAAHFITLIAFFFSLFSLSKIFFMSFTNKNPAVIKSELNQLNKVDFIANAIKIKSLLLELDFTEKNANLRFMYLNLYKWCRCTYKTKF